MLASEFPLLMNSRSSLPRLVTLCDQTPSTPFDVVHKARLKLSKTDVAVKVQHPGAEHLMMVDIRNRQAMALFCKISKQLFYIISC
ncbi:hypothetical protein ZEAMMB73_Zm00001d004081, partial [Zea mays]